MLRHHAWQRLQLRAEGQLPLIVVTIGFFVLFSLAAPHVFPTLLSLQSMAFQLPEVGLLALGVTMTMVAAGIDLSVVAIADLSGLSAAQFLHAAGSAGGGADSWLLTGAALLVALGVGAGMRCHQWATDRQSRNHSNPRHARHVGSLRRRCHRLDRRSASRRAAGLVPGARSNASAWHPSPAAAFRCRCHWSRRSIASILAWAPDRFGGCQRQCGTLLRYSSDARDPCHVHGKWNSCGARGNRHRFRTSSASPSYGQSYIFLRLSSPCSVVSISLEDSGRWLG